MKKIIICLLVLLFTATALADTDILVTGNASKYDNIQVVDRNCFIFEANGDSTVYAIYELVNRGYNMLNVNGDKSGIVFYDAYGRELYSTCNQFTGVYPSSWVNPGQKFFIVERLISRVDSDKAAFPAVMNAKEYSLVLNLYDTAYDNGHMLPVFLDTSATFTFEERSWVGKIFNSSPAECEVALTVRNSTGREASMYGLKYFAVLRDEMGHPVMLTSLTDYDRWNRKTNSVPAGGTLSFTEDITDTDMFTMFLDYDFVPSRAEVYCTITEAYLK